MILTSYSIDDLINVPHNKIRKDRYEKGQEERAKDLNSRGNQN